MKQVLYDSERDKDHRDYSNINTYDDMEKMIRDDLNQYINEEPIIIPHTGEVIQDKKYDKLTPKQIAKYYFNWADNVNRFADMYCEAIDEIEDLRDEIVRLEELVRELGGKP